MQAFQAATAVERQRLQTGRVCQTRRMRRAPRPYLVDHTTYPTQRRPTRCPMYAARGARKPRVDGLPSTTRSPRGCRPGESGRWCAPCGRAMCARRARWAWAARWAAWSTSTATALGVQEVACRRWPPTCRAQSAANSSSKYSIADLRAFTPREMESCGQARGTGVRRTGRHALPPDYRGTTPCDLVADRLRAAPARRHLLLFQRPLVATRPASCSSFSRGSTAPTTSTTARTTATRPVGVGLAQRRSARAPRRVTLEDVEQCRPASSSSARIRLRTIRASCTRC